LVLQKPQQQHLALQEVRLQLLQLVIIQVELLLLAQAKVLTGLQLQHLIQVEQLVLIQQEAQVPQPRLER